MSLFALRSGTPPLTPALVIFDKDGTLIDFDFMWASWVTELGRRIEQATYIALADRLYEAMGYDKMQATVLAGSPLAAHSMAELRALTTRVLQGAGVGREAAELATADAWFVPDPVALARPLGDLPQVFGALREQGILTAIATSDDRASTLETIRGLGIAPLVNALVTADDGLPNKPAPDMLLRVCNELNVLPADAVMVGDAVADMRAARAAGMALCVGVLSGVSSQTDLQPYADVIIENLDGIYERV